VPITRDGKREDVYWTYTFSPIDEEMAPNGVGGVLVVCTETTETVISAQKIGAERERLLALLKQMPGFVGLLSGPEHVYEYVNDAYVTIAGPRDFIGRTIGNDEKFVSLDCVFVFERILFWNPEMNESDRQRG